MSPEQRLSPEQLAAENAELRLRLEEAEETLAAIRSGAVDAFVVAESEGDRIYTLEGADRPYRLLVEQMQQGAATLQASGVIAWCNRRLAEMLRTPHEKLVGAMLRDAIAPDDSRLYDDLVGHGRVSTGSGEVLLKRNDGELVPALLTFNALPEDCGAAMGVLVTDLTAQRFHEHLAAAHEALRASEERLRQLAAELSEANHRKNEFLATLAHELRNPLAPLRNGLQVLKLSKDDPETADTARTMMERQLEQMVRLVDDLLDVSRISRGNVELRREPISLAAVLQSAVETSRPLIEQMGHELIVALPKQPVIVNGDLTRLAQVFLNLLNNAAKYSERQGKIWMTAELRGDEVVVSVKDAGIGLAEEQLPKIFDMFSQVDRSLEKSQGGLGIGLTLVRRLVEMHGGSVEAQSEGFGKGSEFIVRLPVDSSLAPPAEPLVAGVKPVAACRILVADDNVDAAASLGQLLEMMGNVVRTANDGSQAVETAEEFQPDVILLDIGMPKLNGYEACRRIRQQAGGKKVVVVALTGWGQDDDKLRSAEAGFDYHLVKPINPATLEKLLASVRPASV